MGDPPRGTLTTTPAPLRQRVRPSASAASIESVVNPIFSPFARACRRRTSSSLCLDPSRQRSLLRLSLGPTSHQPSSVSGTTPWSEPGFHLGLVGHRFVRSLEGAYPCYRISGRGRDHALEWMLPLDPLPEKDLEPGWRSRVVADFGFSPSIESVVNPELLHPRSPGRQQTSRFVMTSASRNPSRRSTTRSSP